MSWTPTHVAATRYLQQMDDQTDVAAPVGSLRDIIMGFPRSTRAFAHRTAVVLRVTSTLDALVVDHRPEHGTASVILIDGSDGVSGDGELRGAVELAAI